MKHSWVIIHVSKVKNYDWCWHWILSLWMTCYVSTHFVNAMFHGYKLKVPYEGCLESIRPFWITRELVKWPWFNLAASQRRPYCACVNSHSPMGLVSWQWDAVTELCTVWLLHSQWPSEQISFITTLRPPILQLSCRLFWQSIISSRSVSLPTAHIWLPETSGFSQS